MPPISVDIHKSVHLWPPGGGGGGGIWFVAYDGAGVKEKKSAVKNLPFTHAPS